jgi:hypothetical protein
MFRSTRAKLSPARRPSVTPRLEALDSRLVPTSFSSDANNYYIDGDYWADDALVVKAHGGGGFTVTDAAGVTFEIPAGKPLLIHTHFGNDVVRYATDGTFSGTFSYVYVNLGEGNDRFTGTLNRDLTNNSYLGVRVYGAGGNDLITLYGTPTAPAGANDHLTAGLAINAGGLLIAGSRELHATLEGGDGADRILFDYEGVLDGDIDLEAVGWSGDDEVGADLILHGTSSGRLDGKIEGGGGSDSLRFRVVDFSDGDADVDADVYGNQESTLWPDPFSTDTVVRTANVTVH